jgi:hypothetical protein
MPVKRTRRECLQRVPAQTGQQPGRIGTKSAPGNRWSTPPATAGRCRHQTAARCPAWAGRAAGRSQKACRKGNPIWFRNKERHPPQAAEGHGQATRPSPSFRDAQRSRPRNPQTPTGPNLSAGPCPWIPGSRAAPVPQNDDFPLRCPSFKR